MNGKLWNEESKAAYLSLVPSLIIFLVFIAFPILYSLYLSFHEWSLLSPGKSFVGLDNYREVFTSRETRLALKNTLYYSLGAVPLLAAVSLGLALLLQGRRRGVELYRTVLFTPAVLSSVVVALLWSWVFDPHFGLFNHLLSRVGVRGPGWLADPRWAMPAVILTTLWKYVGYYMVIFVAGLQGIPRAYYEAAAIDGAGPVRRLWSITLPLLRRTTAFVLVVATIQSFQVFGLIYVMTGGGPMGSTSVVVHYLYQEAFEFFRMGYASAIAWVLFLIIFVLSFIQLRTVGRRGRGWKREGAIR
ncbi:MAG: carbohydrate ABC transporter permease [Candidatus Bipolaricaulia bacterium]